MRCAQPAVRQGHCARRRVSERNRRTAAALSAEIDTRPTLLPAKGLFDKQKPQTPEYLRLCIEVTGLEPAASWSQTTRATNCATPRCSRAIARLTYYSTKRGGASSPLRKLSHLPRNAQPHKQKSRESSVRG